MRLGNGPYTYAFAGTDAGFGAASERLILIRMLLTAHIFKPSNTSGSEADNLKKHVEARLTIVRNALKAAFSFAPGHQTIDWSGFREDPQAFFEKLSNAHTKMGCQLATRIIFETGNKFGPDRFRNYDFVWIPGDWGYITNLAHVNGTGNFPPGYEGENVIHTARSSRGEMFWGLYQSGIHPADSETGWFEEIRKWRGNHEEQGVPAWQRRITYPSAGLSE
jgi:hypothetical protein